MDSNTSSLMPDRTPGHVLVRPVPAGLEGLAAQIAELVACDFAGLFDGLVCEWVLGVRRSADQLEGCWLRLLVHVDAHGAAGAEQGVVASSTAGWLQARTRMGSAAAHQGVRTAWALYCGPQPLQA